MLIEEQVRKAKAGTPERVVGEYLLERMRNDEDMARRYEDSEYEKQYKIYVSENEVVKNGR